MGRNEARRRHTGTAARGVEACTPVEARAEGCSILKVELTELALRWRRLGVGGRVGRDHMGWASAKFTKSGKTQYTSFVQARPMS